MAMIDRAGTAPLQPESAQEAPTPQERNRHPQTGKFIPTAAAPVKQSGSKPRGKIAPRP